MSRRALLGEGAPAVRWSESNSTQLILSHSAQKVWFPQMGPLAGPKRQEAAGPQSHIRDGGVLDGRAGSNSVDPETVMAFGARRAR